MTLRKNVDGYALAIMMVLCLIWALQQIAMKGVASDIAPLTQAGLRSGIAALLLAVLIKSRGGTLLGPKAHRTAGLLVAVLFGLEFLFVAEGLLFTSASHMAVFLYTAPIFSSLGLHWSLAEERLTRAQWIGISVAFLGILVMFLGGGSAPDLDLKQQLYGDFLGLLGGAAWGGTTVVIRRSSLSNASASQTLFYQLLGAFTLLCSLSFLKGETSFHFTKEACLSLGFQSLIVCFTSYLVWFWLLKNYRASQLGVLTFLTPPLGVFLGVVLLNDSLQPHFVLGTLFTLAGIVSVTGYGWYRQFLLTRAWPRPDCT